MDNELPVYFISDAHLGVDIPGCGEREERLASFLGGIVSRASALYIVGDLFDFWIEYRRAIRPDYFPILYQLKRLADSGVEIHYLAGNHDFALGPFLEQKIGVRIHPDHYATEIQGKRIYLFHGDGLAASDGGYRVLRRVLRNPLYQKFYRILHPDMGVPLGSFFSGSSRKLTSRRKAEKFLEEYRQKAAEYLQKGNDIVVFAHTHYPEIRHWDGKTYCNAGEWIRQFTFAKLQGGAMSLWRYCPGGEIQEIADSSLMQGNSAS